MICVNASANILASKICKSIGKKASLTMFCPDSIYELKEEHIISKSKNCAFINSKLKGKVFGIIKGENIVINNEWNFKLQNPKGR